MTATNDLRGELRPEESARFLNLTQALGMTPAAALERIVADRERETPDPVAEFRGKIAPANERVFTDMVRRVARQLAYMVYHTNDSRRSEPGFPDLTIVHPETGALIFAELKMDSKTSRVSKDQKAWIAAFERAGVDVFLWRPSDWETVLDVLARGVEAR